MDYAIIIPARYGSKRLPGKPLILIKGIPMLVRTYNQCKKIKEEINTYVATDSIRIKNICEKYDIPVIMTSKKCLTGTDRVAEAAKNLKEKYIINVQGDEPLINPKDIMAIIKEHKKNKKFVINGYSEIKDVSQYSNRNIPKVVFNEDNILLYMSRASLPSSKTKIMSRSFRQICIYCYSKDHLKKFTFLGRKSNLEKIEDIEILRFFELNIKVKMLKLSGNSISVDVKSDISKVKKHLN